MHKEYNRRTPNNNAVLFIHGIVGTPDHFKDFVPLVPEQWSVYNVLLDGHGGRVEDFTRTSMKKWKTQVNNKLEEISQNHDNIIIVAHSMGSLLSMQAFSGYKDRIKAMFFLQSPIKLFIRPRLIGILFKVLYNNIKPEDVVARAASDAYSIDRDKRLWKYLGWIPRFLELFKEIRRTRKVVEGISAPVYVFQSAKDELVSISGVKYFQGNPNIHVEILDNSTHFYYEKNDYEHMLSEFQSRGKLVC